MGTRKGHRSYQRLKVERRSVSHHNESSVRLHGQAKIDRELRLAEYERRAELGVELFDDQVTELPSSTQPPPKRS